MKFENIFLEKKKNFALKIILREKFPDFGKNFIISFFHPLCLGRKSFPAGKDFHRDQENS